jgi:hypothetical protein
VSASATELRLGVPATPSGFVVASGLSAAERSTLEGASEPALRQALAVFVEGPDDPPPMLGAVRLEAESLVFVPRLPFVPGQPYRARLQVADRVLERPFKLLRSSPPPGEVVGITPDVEVVPENLLRIYVHFASAMRGGDAYRRIGLLDHGGEPIEQAFVETVPELWDRDRRRLTLVLHPGRIKRGLRMREARGPALKSGQRVTLRIDEAMETASGAPLGRSWERTFEVAEVDRRSPATDAWRLRVPAAGGRGALIVEFDEPLDRELLSRMVAVESAAGETVAGRVEIAPDGGSWALLPARPWPSGDLRLLVHPAIEDLAGNRLDRPFDVEAGAATGNVRLEPVRIPVRISGSSPGPS